MVRGDAKNYIRKGKLCIELPFRHGETLWDTGNRYSAARGMHASVVHARLASKSTQSVSDAAGILSNIYVSIPTVKLHFSQPQVACTWRRYTSFRAYVMYAIHSNINARNVPRWLNCKVNHIWRASALCIYIEKNFHASKYRERGSSIKKTLYASRISI